MTDPTHIAELKPAQRALADQSIREILLAIIVGQGKAVTIPIDHLDRIAADHRLIIEIDRQAGVVKLSSELFAAQIIAEATKPALIEGSIPQDPASFKPRRPRLMLGRNSGKTVN